MDKKRSFWERLTGGLNVEEEESVEQKRNMPGGSKSNGKEKKIVSNWIEEENDEAELAIDVYQTPKDIIIETMVAGVKPEDIELTITRDMITIRGKREELRTIDENNYFSQELYWGRFSRTISLPQEVEPEEVEATEKHGLLVIKLQKVDKDKTNNVRIKSL
jgi:HSP20 family protein